MIDRLPDILAGYRDAEFEWGKLDCCLFCAEVVRELHGKDFATGWRARYRSKAGALRLMEEYGGVEGIVREILGEPVPPLLARRGDPVLAREIEVVPEGESLGIADGRHAVLLTQRGLVTVPLQLCAMGWRIE